VNVTTATEKPNSWTKDKYTDEWLVRVPGGDAIPGDVVEVTKRNGDVKEVELGEVKVKFDDATLFRVAKREAKAETSDEPKKPPVDKPGVFEKDGETYIVKWNRAKTGMYALKLVDLTPAQGDRVRDDGEDARYETEYVRGVVFQLTEDDRMSLEKGKQLTLKYGRCIACGAGLRVKESLEAGMGPVCRKKFA
jgi:hypothetical protein